MTAPGGATSLDPTASFLRHPARGLRVRRSRPPRRHLGGHGRVGPRCRLNRRIRRRREARHLRPRRPRCLAKTVVTPARQARLPPPAHRRRGRASHRRAARRRRLFDKGVRAALRAMLTSPSFYRSEVGERQPDGTYKLTPWETASALSYSSGARCPTPRSSTPPSAATSGRRRASSREARRLLASPRARATVATFAEQWLGSESVGQVTKSDALYPFPNNLRAAMLEETRSFVTHVVFDGSHSARRALHRRLHVRERRARQALRARRSASRRRRLADRAPRGGNTRTLRALASSATAASSRRRRTPIRRRPSAAASSSGAASFPRSSGAASRTPARATGRPRGDDARALRATHGERVLQEELPSVHRRRRSASSVSNTNGRLRTTEAGKPIDAKGDMNDVEGLGKGTHAPYSSMGELGRIVASSDAAKTCVVRQVYRFARGRLDDDICRDGAHQAALSRQGRRPPRAR